MQHVLFVVNSYPPRLGGLENHVASLAARLVADGHRATVVTLADRPGDEAVERGVRVIRRRGHVPIASVISFPSPGTARRIAAEFRGTGITAVSTHTRFFPMSFVGASVARRLGVPHIHTEHGSAHVKGVSWPIGLASRLVDFTAGRMILRRATVVLAVSEHVSAFVRRLAGVGSELFYNAIDPPPPRTSPSGADFVFVGRIVPGKGWDDLVTATRQLRDREPDRPLSVDVLGSGPESARLESLVEQAGLTDVIRVRGQVPSAAVNAALQGSVLVNPTRLSEGFQTTLLEALAAGGQVVTYPVPGAARLRADGAPIRIATSSTVTELVELMADARDQPLPALTPQELAAWTWPERARQYVEVLERATAR